MSHEIRSAKPIPIADILGKGYDTISGYCRSGELEAEKIKGAWAIPKSSIRKFKEQRNKAKYRNDWEPSEEQREEMKTVLLDLIQANQNKRALYQGEVKI